MNKVNEKYGTLYGIGVGPGGEELLTLKAVKVLESCDVVIAPSAMPNGKSIALETAKNFIKPQTEIIIKHFPMGGEEQEEKIYEAYKAIDDLLMQGKDVAFLTIGDPFVYSTYIYLLNHIKEKKFNVETVPGITSFCAAASIAGETLVIGEEPLLILPASKVECIRDEKHVVIMKLYKCEEKVLDVLEEKGFKYICVKRAYREGQEVLTNREDIINSRDYMSLIIANR
jgi:precorrin-2/cobalt-factor-2 C20-methyltransferase